MLKQMRSGAQSKVVKLALFGLLLLAMTGLALIGGQGTFRDALKDDTIASIGRTKISAAQFDHMVRDALHQQHMKQSDAYKAGLPRQVLRQEINNRIFSMAAADAGLLPDDVMAARQVKDIISPLVEKGLSKEDALQRLEQSYNINEDQLVATIKAQVATDTLLKVISSGISVPQQLTDDALKFRNEYRRGDYFRLTPASLGALKEPSDAELKSYYDSIASEYSLPEYRTLSIIILDKKSLGDSAKISDDRLKQYYEENINDYKTTESRVISQVVATDKAAADAVYAAAQKSKNLQAAAREAAKGKANYIKPAAFTEKEIAAELSKAAFSGKAGEVLAPVQSPLGWHVLYIEKISGGATKSFESVKANIEKELSQDKISEALYQRANKIDDELGGGRSVSEVAKENGIAETVLEKIDAHGVGADGKKQGANLPVPDKLVASGFSLEKGAASQLIETPDGAYVIVGAKEIYPSEQQPFAKVRANVLARWTTDRQLKALSEKAAQTMERLKQGETFEKIAADVGQSVQSTGLIQRGTASAKAGLESTLIAALFSLDKMGGATTVANDNTVTVVRLADRKIQVPAASAKKDTSEMTAILERAIKQDLLEQYRQNLMSAYSVRINDKLLNAMYAPKDDNGADADTEE